MKQIFLIISMLLISINLFSSPPDSCLKMICSNDIHFDVDIGEYVGSANPDSVLIDTCTGSPTIHKRFAKRYFTLQFEKYFYPFDSVLKPHTEKTVSDISDSKPECKLQFLQLEAIYGTIYFEGELYEAENDSIFYLNPGARLYFESYQDIDEIESVFINNIDSLNYISYYGRYGSPLSDIKEANISKKNFLIYPNPVKNILEINLEENETPEFISIFNLYGQKVFESEFEEQIDVSSLASGVYFLRIGNRNYKFIKE